MTTDLPTQLLDLRRSILTMGALVHGRVAHVLEALVARDFEAAREIRHGDREVDVMEVDIEQQCIEVLALSQPVARDLRFVMAILRINGELERIGDLAKGIAKRLVSLHPSETTMFPPTINEMAAAVLGMLDDALKALSNNDADLARGVYHRDDEVDAFWKKTLDWSSDQIHEEVDRTDFVLDLLSVARKLERLGDNTTNISEDIIFLVEGEVVRHTKI